MQIINLSPERWQEYKRIRLEALKEAPQAYLSDYETNLHLPDEKWQQRLKDSGNKMFFVEDEGKVVGMGGYFIDPSPKNSHVAHIFSVYINLAYRGKGLGKQLMETILNALSANSVIEKVSLEITASQESAHQLYIKLGFKDIGRRTKELKIDGVYYDEILMEKFT